MSSQPAGPRYTGLVLAVLAPALLIVGFALLKPAPVLAAIVLGAAGWVAVMAEDEDEAVLYRLVGWAVLLAVVYLLVV